MFAKGLGSGREEGMASFSTFPSSVIDNKYYQVVLSNRCRFVAAVNIC